MFLSKLMLKCSSMYEEQLETIVGVFWLSSQLIDNEKIRHMCTMLNDATNKLFRMYELCFIGNLRGEAHVRRGSLTGSISIEKPNSYSFDPQAVGRRHEI